MTDRGFFDLTRKLVDLSNELCDGKLVLTLEGGYGLDGLAYGVIASFAALLGDQTFDDPVRQSKPRIHERAPRPSPEVRCWP